MWMGATKMARGRRADTTREQLTELALKEGATLMAEVGYRDFSARELARRIGYSVTAVLSAMGGSDGLVVAINTRTFVRWADRLDLVLAKDPQDRIAALVGAYFAFARSNPKSWSAIYDHKLPFGETIPEEQAESRGRLTGIVAREISSALPGVERDDVASLTRSLVATVHGHCALELSGSYDLMGGASAEADALARVREALSSKTADADGEIR
jgi:AcrR family transcriptional regulator